MPERDRAIQVSRCRGCPATTSGTVTATAVIVRHPGPEVDPAGEPAEGPVRQPLGPLVDRPGDREVARQLGEIQGDEGLAR